MAQIRPVTSKARGICRYYTTPRGCFAGDNCKFLHGEPKPEGELSEGERPLLTPYDKAKRCRYFDQGFCKRGEKCWFLHKSGGKRDTQVEEEDEFCSICFEKPSTYGLLGGCSHVFCVVCIKQWRDKQNKSSDVLESGNTKKCPMCRAPSRFITPSSKFWKDGTEEKQKATQAYMESMAKVPCRYFQKSLVKNKHSPICPYGKDCFYEHVKEDGTPFIFKHGVEVCMKRYRSLNRRISPLDFLDIHLTPAGFRAVDLLQSVLDIETGMAFVAGPSNTTESNTTASPSSNSAVNANSATDLNRELDRFSHVAGRLREVGRSLDILEDAIVDNGWTEIDHLLDALRMRAGRIGSDTGRGSGSVQQQQNSGGRADEAIEDEVMERLESLADHMLASVDAMGSGMETEDGDTREAPSSSHIPSPPPILELLGDGRSPTFYYLAGRIMRDLYDGIEESEMPALETIPMRDVHDEIESEMPALESIPNSSESESDDGSVDDSEPEDQNEDGGGDGDMNEGEVSEEISIGRQVLAPHSDELLRSVVNETSMGVRFSTVVDRREDRHGLSGQTQSTAEVAAVGGDSDETIPSESVSPSALNEPVTQLSSTVISSPTATRLNKCGGSSRPSDGFTTDGRGRVISFGDTATRPPQAAPVAEHIVTPESLAPPETETETESRGERRGIWGWIGQFGSLI